jgi:hypothetical protein
MRRPFLSHVLIGYSDVGQRLVAAEGTVVGEFDVPEERRGSRIRIERHRHLSSVRVSVDAVLERDRRQLDVREHQVRAAVVEDDHCEVSRRRDLWFRHAIDVQNPRATNRVRRWIQDLTVTGDELAVRKRAKVGLSVRGQRRTRGGHEDGEYGDDVSQDIFSVFHNMIFFSCFGFVAVVLGNPETQTVSHSFPKICAALQKKVVDRALRAPELRRRLVRSQWALGRPLQDDYL